MRLLYFFSMQITPSQILPVPLTIPYDDDDDDYHAISSLPLRLAILHVYINKMHNMTNQIDRMTGAVLRIHNMVTSTICYSKAGTQNPTEAVLQIT